MSLFRPLTLAVLSGVMVAGSLAATASAQTTLLTDVQPYPRSWDREFPLGDFTRATIDFGEVQSGGPPRDGIPAINDPKFVSLAEARERYTPQEPVIGIEINGEAKAYPLQILTWHEIANDVVGGVPVAVTYCPLCNAAIVFDARIDGKTHDFGVSGRLRKSDMLMYDRQTESWWQQFNGDAVTGDYAGRTLTKVPSRLESFERFAERHPGGTVLVPTREGQRQYGRNPYRSYDNENGRPFLYRGDLPDDIPAMARVIVAEGFEDKAYAMNLLSETGRLEDGDLVLTWEAGQNSALDASNIQQGRDVGNIVAQARQADGSLADIVYDVTFAFVYQAFVEDGTFVQ